MTSRSGLPQLLLRHKRARSGRKVPRLLHQFRDARRWHQSRTSFRPQHWRRASGLLTKASAPPSGGPAVVRVCVFRIVARSRNAASTTWPPHLESCRIRRPMPGAATVLPAKYSRTDQQSAYLMGPRRHSRLIP